MAGIVINTKFNPFTYLELLAPALLMTELHMEVEKLLANLKAQASKWKRLANSETDPIAHALYQRFANDLEVLAAALSNRGLTTTSRRDLYDMAARYQSEIVPIEEAHKRREELIKALLASSALNPTLIYSRKALTTSLDDYLNDPSLSYELVSGQHITLLVYNQAKALAERINSSSISDSGDFIKFSTSRGVTPKDVMKVILGDPDANPELVEIIENTIDMTGTRDWGQEALDQIYAAARLGAWGAVGKEDINYQQDWRAQLEMSHAFLSGENAKSRAFSLANRNSEKYTDTGTDVGGRRVWYDNENSRFIYRNSNGTVELPVLTELDRLALMIKLKTSHGLPVQEMAYGGPLTLMSAYPNKFSEGGSMSSLEDKPKKYISEMDYRLLNLSPEEAEYLAKEREVLRKMGTGALKKLHLGHTPGEWDIYLGNGPGYTEKDITLSEMKKGRATILPFVMDAFLDSTDSGLDDEEDSGGIGAISAEDNSISLIYDGSLRGSELKDHPEIKLSDSFWEDIDNALAEKKYSFFTAKGEYKEKSLGRGDVRIYVDHDSATDNHFIIVPIENDIFLNDKDYSRRVKNKQDYDSNNIINNLDTRDKNKKANIKK